MRKILPPLEVYFYCASWIFGILYSTYKVYSIGNLFSDSFAREHLVEGWSILDRKKDYSDREWSEWSLFILYTLSGWIIVNYVGARAVSLINTKGVPLFAFLKPLWYMIVTSTFLIYHYGFASLIVFLLQPTLFLVLMLFKNARLKRLEVWCFSYILYFIFTLKISPISLGEKQTLVMPALMWTYLRCISFYLEEEPKKLNWVSVFSFFGYVFYLPTFFFGPIILYSNFSGKICNGPRSDLVPQSLGLLIANNIRYLFWMMLTEFILHYVYIHALLEYIEHLSKINDNVWLMYGIGFGMGQLFFLKYTVVYGLSLTWTKAEGYNVPQPPKCVACICLYSDMWRVFDEGLYQFIHRYIYQPLSRTLSSTPWGKVCSGFLCFVFVFVWHGIDNSIFWWSSLNFCGIFAERVAQKISKTNRYLKLKRVLGPRNESRFIGVICTPLTIVSAISNFCFIADDAVMKTYFIYVFQNDNLSSTFCLWFFVYCLCQVSLHLAPTKPYRKR